MANFLLNCYFVILLYRNLDNQAYCIMIQTLCVIICVVQLVMYDYLFSVKKSQHDAIEILL